MNDETVNEIEPTVINPDDQGEFVEDEPVEDEPRNNGYLAIPDDTASILARGNPRSIAFNDRVQSGYFHLRDFGTEEAAEFREMRQACKNDHAVEGHLKADDYESARLLRDHCRIELGDHIVAKADLHTIARAIGVVERRFKISRRQRAQLR